MHEGTKKQKYKIKSKINQRNDDEKIKYAKKEER